MASSPYLTDDLKEYIKKHKIENVLSSVVNDLLN